MISQPHPVQLPRIAEGLIALIAPAERRRRSPGTSLKNFRGSLRMQESQRCGAGIGARHSGQSLT